MFGTVMEAVLSPATVLAHRVRAFAGKRFEHFFVLVTLATTLLIYFLIPQKLALLNFYYLPVILAAYYLGRRQAVPAAFFSVLVIAAWVTLSPESFYYQTTRLAIILHITTWGGFLILAAALAGTLKEQLVAEFATIERLNVELQAKQEELLEANALLEQSKRTVETLKRKVEDTLYATMDSVVANLIIEDRLRNEKRSVSILFSDLVGFTPYAEEHPPEVVIRDLNRYLSEIEPVLLAYHGHIDKYMGDGIMCEFGAPLDFDTHALLAVLAGMKMQERMSRRDYPWRMRVGIASGSTITGVIGLKRQTYTAIGDIVNLGARLQQSSSPQGVLIDGATYEDVKRWIDARKKRDLPTHDMIDPEKERQLQALHERIATDPGDAESYFQIGRIHAELLEFVEALSYFGRALELGPDNIPYKVAYAETSLKVREQERIAVKGKRRRVEAYEVTGIKDPLANRDKFPQAFVDQFGSAVGLLQIPDDVVLPVEGLDGSIGHSKGVAVIAYALASSFDLTDREKLDIMHAGFVADLGKEAVPQHILTRKGRLPPTEYEVVKQHPVEGTRILRKLGYDNETILDIVLHSHEAFNGSGYPSGLRGEAIPFGSRIVAVADAYDAMTSWLPYRDAWERSAALDEIGRGVSRGLYDPSIAQALARLMG